MSFLKQLGAKNLHNSILVYIFLSIFFKIYFPNNLNYSLKITAFDNLPLFLVLVTLYFYALGGHLSFA